MKKVMTLFCAAVIASTPFAGTVQALENENSSTNPIEKEAGVEQQTEETQNKDLKVLTLEDVLKRGLENDVSFILLEYQLESSKNQILNTENDKWDTEMDIRSLEDALDDLKEIRDQLKGGEIASVLGQIAGLEDKIKLLEKAIEEVKSGQIILQLQTEEAKEGMTLQLTSTYMNLLSLQDQINFMKKSIQSAAEKVNRTERLYEYGVGSKDDIDQAKRAQVNLEKQLKQKEKDYYYNLAVLTFDINVNYNPNIALTHVETKIEDADTVLAAAIANAIKRAEKDTDVSEENTKVENASVIAEDEKTDVIEEENVNENESTGNTDIDVNDYEILIESTFKMMEAKEKLELANYNLDEVYEDSGSDQYDKLAEDYNVKIAEEQITQLREQLTKKIDELTHNIQTSKFNYEEAARKLEDAQTDINNLEKKYQLGVISKFDYEQAKLQLEELKLNIETTKTNYFLIQQSIKALGNGYIQ